MFIIRQAGSPEWPVDAWTRVWAGLPRMACGCVDTGLGKITGMALGVSEYVYGWRI